VTADGSVVVPIDTEAFGFWLKGAFGAPVTTGTGPYTHVFTSGSWSLPSLSIETGLPEVPSYAMYGGCMVDKIGWQMARSGLLTANVDLIAQGETLATTSGAGTPAPVALKRFGHFNGSLTRNGADIGNIVGAELSYANNLDRVETIRADGKIEGADPSIAAMTGKIDVRFTVLFERNKRVPPHPPLRPSGQWRPQGQPRQNPCLVLRAAPKAGDCAGCRDRSNPSHAARTVPMLRRTHAHHRDLPSWAETDVTRATTGAGSMTDRPSKILKTRWLHHAVPAKSRCADQPRASPTNAFPPRIHGLPGPQARVPLVSGAVKRAPIGPLKSP